MGLRFDIGSLQVRETGIAGVLEVSIDGTKDENTKEWENAWNAVTILVNTHETPGTILDRLRTEYERKYTVSSEVSTMKRTVLTALKNEKTCKEFTRQDPNPPRAAPMEVKVVP